MAVTQVTPDGSAFQGFPWSDQVTFTVKDAQNNPIDMTASTWEILSEQLDAFTLDVDLSQAATGVVTLTVSLTETALSAYRGNSFRWYAGETTVIDAPLLWRKVKVDNPQ